MEDNVPSIQKAFYNNLFHTFFLMIIVNLLMFVKTFDLVSLFMMMMCKIISPGQYQHFLYSWQNSVHIFEHVHFNIDLNIFEE